MNGNPGIPVRSDAMRAMLLLKIRAGMPYKAAASVCGISEQAFHNWKNDDPTFAADCTAAKNDFMQTLLKRALEHATNEGKDSWAATAWLLERRFFEFFSRKERVTTTNPNGDPEESVIARTSEEPIDVVQERLLLVQRLLAGAGVGDQDGGSSADAEADAVHTSPTAPRPNGLSSP